MSSCLLLVTRVPVSFLFFLHALSMNLYRFSTVRASVPLPLGYFPRFCCSFPLVYRIATGGISLQPESRQILPFGRFM